MTGAVSHHRVSVEHWAATVAVAVGLGLGVFGCGPRVGAENSAGASDTGTDSDGAVSASTTGSGTSSDSHDDVPFACPPTQELIPGYCFERYDIELPGPLVMGRAVGADLDGDGAASLALELELEGRKTLTLWDFDEVEGASLYDELEYAPEAADGDFEGTKLLAGWRPDPGYHILYRTENRRITVCELDSESRALSCTREYTSSTHPDPILVGHTISCCGGDDLTTTVDKSEDHPLGLILYSGGSNTSGEDGMLGGFQRMSAPPCETPIALAHGDFNGDGLFDVAYRSSADCVDQDYPERREVGVNLGRRFLDAQLVIDPGIDTELILGLDVDLDGIDELLAAGAIGSAAQYRVLSWRDEASPSSVDALGPDRVDRLAKADLHGDGSVDVVFVEDRTHVSRSPFEAPYALPDDLGPLVAVLDANGDGRDDLLLAGRNPAASLILLVSR